MSSLGARRFNVLWRFGLGLGWVDSRRVLLVLSWFSGSLCAGRSPDPWRCLTASPYPVSAAGPLVCSLPLFESRCASSLYQPGSLFTFFTYNKFYLKKKIGSIVYIIFTKFLCIMCVCACVCVCVCFFLLRLISLLHMSILDERFCYILTVSLPGAQVLPCSPRCLDY